MRLQTQADTTAALEADARRLEKEVDQITSAMKESGRAQMKKLGEAKEAAEAARATADRLKAQYFEVLASAEREERERLVAANPTEAQLKSGAITAEEYLRDHRELSEISARAKAFAAEKVRLILGPARAAALDALKAEVAVVELEVECAYCHSAPLQARLEVAKARVKQSDAAANIALGELALAMTKRDTIRRKFEVSTGYSHRGGWRFDGLTAEQLAALRFEPVITDEQLPKLEELIALAGNGEGVVCESVLISGTGALTWMI